MNTNSKEHGRQADQSRSHQPRWAKVIQTLRSSSGQVKETARPCHQLSDKLPGQ